MNRTTIVALLCCGLLCACISAYAEEPILVIDPHGHSSQISEVLFTPDGSTLISTSFDKTIRLWDVQTGELLRTFRHQIGEGHDGEIHAAALSPDGKILAVGGITDENNERGIPVYLFDLESGDIIGVLDGHSDAVMALDFSSDGHWLASANDFSVFVWELATRDAGGTTLYPWRPRREKTSGDAGGTVFTLTSESKVFDVAFAPDGKRLVSGHVDGSVRIWELPQPTPNPSQEGNFVVSPQYILKEHNIVAGSVDWSPDGKYIVSGDFYGNAFLWDAQTGTIKKQFQSMDGAADLTFSPDSQYVVLGNGPRVEVYTVPNLKKTLSFSKHANLIKNNAFSNNVTAIAFYGNDLIATAGGNDYEIYIWNVKTGEVQTHIAGQGKRVEAVAFSENLELAFGNVSGGRTKGGKRIVGPLNQFFDFDAMLMYRKLRPTLKFTRAQTRYEDKRLEFTPGYKDAENWYRLNIKGGGTIQNGAKDGWVRSYTFTPQGDIVVGSSHVLKLHRSDGVVIREFVGHNGEVWDVAVSRNGRMLASASDDQTIKLWNLKTGENLATLFVARDKEWVCWTPEGYYAASAGGEQYIGWQVNQGRERAALYYPVSVFRNQLYKPERVKEALKKIAEAPPQINAQPRGVILPPLIEWIEPRKPKIETKQPSIPIRVKIRSDSTVENNQITSFKILVNGRTQATEQKISLDRASDFYKEFEYDVPLTKGKNEITVFAATQHAAAPSEKLVVLCEVEGDDWLKSDLYLVSVGISDYPLNDLTLTYADDDARSITQVFRNQSGKLYREVFVKELYDQDATRGNMIEALGWLQEHAKQGDVAVVFIAAHGFRAENGQYYYILPVDGNPERLLSSGVSSSTLSQILGNLPSRVLMLLDTCHSGQFGQNILSQRSLTESKILSDNTEALRELSSAEYGVVILAASTGGEVSLENAEWGHGAFTAALLEALEQGLADYPPKPDGIVHVRELDMYVDYRVRELTDDSQHPTTQKPSTISRFPVVQVK